MERVNLVHWGMFVTNQLIMFWEYLQNKMRIITIYYKIKLMSNVCTKIFVKLVLLFYYWYKNENINMKTTINIIHQQ